LQAFDLFGSDQGTGIAFRQQTRIVVVQHRQGRHLVTVGQHGVGQTEFDRSAALGQVIGRLAAVATFEEVDTAGTAAIFAAFQVQGVQAESIDTHADGALGEAGRERTDSRLAPLGFVRVAVFVITVDVGIAQQHFEAAVFYKTLGLGLAVSHGLCGTQHPQCDQTDSLVQHFVFLITG